MGTATIFLIYIPLCSCYNVHVLWLFAHAIFEQSIGAAQSVKECNTIAGNGNSAIVRFGNWSNYSNSHTEHCLITMGRVFRKS